MAIAAAYGATAALCALAAVHFLVLAPRGPAALPGAAFCASVALSSVFCIPEVAGAAGPLRDAVLVLTSGKMAFFWWFALALFDDRFRLRPWHLAPWAALTVLGGAMAAGNLEETGYHLGHATILALFAHVMLTALRDFRGDLVDSRRRFRIAVALGIPVAVTLVIGVHTAEMLTGRDLPVREMDALVALGLAFAFTLWLTRLEAGVSVPAADADVDAAPPSPLTPADVLDLKRIEAAAAEGICLEPGLTIGALAARLGLPEHRARRLINRGLGYRNFADFLNAHRIAEAEARLADPALAREQIIAHAFALGYNSLAPFNRAFRARTGLSPTEFRSRALATVAAE